MPKRHGSVSGSTSSTGHIINRTRLRSPSPSPIETLCHIATDSYQPIPKKTLAGLALLGSLVALAFVTTGSPMAGLYISLSMVGLGACYVMPLLYWRLKQEARIAIIEKLDAFEAVL